MKNSKLNNVTYEIVINFYKSIRNILYEAYDLIGVGIEIINRLK